MTEKFKRLKEDFICEHCGKAVTGNGYTNHCPACLWSKHVDIHPGDRAAVCRAMMEPLGLETRGGEYVLLHRCVSCGHEQSNRVAREDDSAVVFSLAGPASRRRKRPG